MKEKMLNLPMNFEPKRDAFGFAVRPHHLQRYREYADIYKEEEDERLDKWKNFLEQLSTNVSCSTEGENGNAVHDEATGQKTEAVLEKREEGDDLTERNNGELPTAKETNNQEVQKWRNKIRPSLVSIGKMMSLRVKKRKHFLKEEITLSQHHLPSSEEVRPSGGLSEEDCEEISIDEFSSEHVFPWKQELEFLVQGGVPKDLRGEVWQAFAGVSTRWVERYYQDLLAPETHIGDKDLENLLSDNSNRGTCSEKWRRQIEKDLPRTFPGHPALDGEGRNSLRHLLLAYARHNPAVGYCQGMNFFAGLLLLLMPEENAFWTLVGIIDDYFDGYFSEDMIESQVDQLVFEELMRERFPKLVNHLDYLGIQVPWISGPWFLSIFVNILPWETVLRVWDVLLFEGNRVMLFRTALALMDLYGPALVTTKDAGDVITLLQSLTGSTFDSSQLVLTACMGFVAVTEARLQNMRQKHRPEILKVVEERSKGVRAWKDSGGLASKLFSFKQDRGSSITETDRLEKDIDASQLVSHSTSFNEFLNGLMVDSEIDSLPDLKEQVVWLKVELCRLLEEKRSATLRAEELETALMEMVKQDNRRQLSARIEQLEQEVAELRQALAYKQEQENAMLQVLMRLEQEQRVTEDARIFAEQDAAAQRYAVHLLQEKYEKAMATLAQMEKRVLMAESMLEATLQYESGQVKAQPSLRIDNQGLMQDQTARKGGLLSIPFGIGWRDRNKGTGTNAEEPIGSNSTNERTEPST